MRVELFVMVMRQQLSWNARIFRYIGILKNWPDDQSRFVDHEWGHPRAMRPCSPSKSLFSFGFHIFLARSLFHASSHRAEEQHGQSQVFACLCCLWDFRANDFYSSKYLLGHLVFLTTHACAVNPRVAMADRMGII